LCAQRPAQPGAGDGAVVAEHLQGEQPVVQRRAGAAAGEQGRGAASSRMKSASWPGSSAPTRSAMPITRAPPAVAR
jgi:hypothetical protein